MRLPRPVLIDPCEIKNAATISQIVLLLKPLRAWLMVSVPLSAVAAMPNRAMAPMGKGLAIISDYRRNENRKKMPGLGLNAGGGGNQPNYDSSQQDNGQTKRLAPTRDRC